MAEKRIIVELEEGWSFMERGISKLRNILENVEGEAAFTAEENVHLYTTIYNMCTQKPPHDYSNRLYERYREALNKYITSKVLPALREKHGEHMLRELVKRWENHKLMVRWLKRMIDYLDRYYISRYSLAPLRDVGMLCFRDLVYTVWKGPIKDGVLALIDRERAGEQIDRSLVKHVLGLFVEMGMGSMDAYEADFEAHALTNCGQFYAAQSAAWVAVDSCPEYMVKAEECLRSEKERVDAYLHASSEPKLLKEAERELLTTHQALLLEKEHSGVAALLRDDKLDDLSRMFRLFSRVKDGLKPVADIFKKHVEAEGMNKVKAVEEALTQKTAEGGSKADESEHAFMRSIIELHDKQMSTVMDCFASNSLFHKALKEAFEVFCNKKVHTKLFAELLASFADKLLKKGSAERLSDEAVEESLDKVVKLLAYVSDKDVFGERCRSMLSKRLLHEQSASEDAERILLAKLKHQCGAQFTSRMEGMVTDLALAKDMQSNFSSWMSEREEPQSKGLDLSVTVITTGFWPTSKFVELNLPQEMVACVEQFKTFYEQRSTARKLTWMYTHGTAIVNGRFAAKPIELQVNTFQAAVLLLFNDTEGELSFAEMKAALGLPEEDLVRTLHSLSCAKYALLKKTPANKKVEPTCTFSFNAAFTDKARRIRVGVPPINETRKTMETVEGDRKHSVEAAIVRVMKSRKVMVHNTLITDVTQILSPMFKPDLKMIKKRIEDLISREFISRDPEVANQYHYVA